MLTKEISVPEFSEWKKMQCLNISFTCTEIVDVKRNFSFSRVIQNILKKINTTESYIYKKPPIAVQGSITMPMRFQVLLHTHHHNSGCPQLLGRRTQVEISSCSLLSLIYLSYFFSFHPLSWAGPHIHVPHAGLANIFVVIWGTLGRNIFTKGWCAELLTAVI